MLGEWQGSVIINFADEGTPDVKITLRARVTEVPIFLKRPINDYQTVCYDHVYRDSLVVYNRGKTAMKCELSLPELVGLNVATAPSNKRIAVTPLLGRG